MHRNSKVWAVKFMRQNTQVNFVAKNYTGGWDLKGGRVAEEDG